MNILEIAKSIGAEDQGAGLIGGAFIGAVRVDWLERFVAAIYAARAQADHIADADKMVREPVAVVDANDDGYWADILPDRSVKVGQKLYAAPVRTKDLTDFGCVPNSNGTTNQRGELLSALEALLEDYIHRVQDAWIEAGGSDISREEVLTNCEPARNAAAAIANMTGATDELP